MEKKMMKGAKLPGNSTVAFGEFEIPSRDMDKYW